MPDYKLVTAVPVVVLDDEQKLAAVTATATTAEMNSSDTSSNISHTGSTASLANTTRNGKYQSKSIPKNKYKSTPKNPKIHKSTQVNALKLIFK